MGKAEYHEYFADRALMTALTEALLELALQVEPGRTREDRDSVPPDAIVGARYAPSEDADARDRTVSRPAGHVNPIAPRRPGRNECVDPPASDLVRLALGEVEEPWLLTRPVPSSRVSCSL